MRITTKYILSLDPCKDRLDNYLNFYKDTDFSVAEFLKLENLSYTDKIWVWKKFATINEAALFGLKCAESVLHIFESKYPGDKRPSKALESVRSFLNDPTEENKKLCRAANAAANAANAAYAADAASARKTQQDKNIQFLVEIYS